MNIGARVAYHRRRKGWSQKDLARKSGLGIRTIQRLEHDMDDVVRLVKLAELFGISWLEFLPENLRAPA